MARPQTGKKKPPKRKTSGKDPSLKTHLLRIIAGLSVLLILVVAAGFLAHHFMLRRVPVRPLPYAEKAPVHEAPRHHIPPFEIFPKEEAPPITPPTEHKAPLPDKIPKVAIIIDDLGYDRIIAEKFLNLDAVFTYSLLPYSPFQKKIANAARKKGFDTILHLPMEPVEYPSVNPGSGALLTSMSADQLIRQLNINLDTIPGIKGVNNHMGSKMTAVSTQMYQILSVLKKRGLFFIDSRSTPETICRPSARLFKIPFAQRDVFLDHNPDPEFIRGQIKHLIDIANKNGTAIGIAHPHQETYEVLRQELPGLKEKVHLVPASEVVHIIG